MRITILGSGAAGGVPTIGSGWGRCDPLNPKNRRRRPSILIEDSGKIILIDSGPDLREQLLSAEINRLDAVLYTHAHADHLHGIDDLREINRAMRAPIPIFGSKATLADIEQRFSYVFQPLNLTTDSIYKPWLIPHAVSGKFLVGDLEIFAFDQDHGFSRTTGFRIGSVAYSTDVLHLPEESIACLGGLDLWIVGCLQDVPHPTHADIGKALAWHKRLHPKHMVITHMSPQLDYATLAAGLPPAVEPAYDGMTIIV